MPFSNLLTQSLLNNTTTPQYLSIQITSSIMCSSKSKLVKPTEVNVNAPPAATTVSDINGRPVLQPATSNRVLTKCAIKKSLQQPPQPLHTTTPNAKTTNNALISPRLKSPPPTKCITTKIVSQVKKSKKSVDSGGGKSTNPNLLVVKYSSAEIVDSPGSIAAARREQVAVMQVQRKMKIAHYGRSKSAKYDSCNKLKTLLNPNSLINTTTVDNAIEEKRCSFISHSDPIYVAYHDEEWGLPVHDDKMLFEMLVLTTAQIGSDWTSVLKKRQHFREAFSEFEPEIVSKFTDLNITTISSSYGIDLRLIRGAVNNSNCILEVKKAFGSFDKYIWGFVNHKPIATNYKLNHKMPVKTSKSEAISKDMMRRGFRHVGPTIIHSFMQAVGLTNDHLTTCLRHRYLTVKKLSMWRVGREWNLGHVDMTLFFEQQAFH